MYAVYYDRKKIFESVDYDDCLFFVTELGLVDGCDCDLVDMTTGEILVSYQGGKCVWNA